HRVTPTEAGQFMDEDLFPEQCELVGSMLKVPEGPGLGVEFNEELAQEQEFKFWEAPHLRRRDGSHTNW
ncbi:MAG: mandelate racemase/muconate lactonizing enzyme family protein, partial [Gemmatimonadetes bacterium]|nr:mandelate racemase/muconate lactonizing enzyme family protein [Gemmatimonadota bacterium]